METINQKYVDFLNYLTLTLVERKSHKMSFGLLLIDYSSKTKIVFYETEINEFLSLYEGEYFKEISDGTDTVIITDKSKNILKRYGSFRNYIDGKTISKFSKIKSIAIKIHESINFKKIVKYSWALVVGIGILLGIANNWLGVRDKIFPIKNVQDTKAPKSNEDIPNKNDSLKDSLTISKTDSILIK